MCRCKTTSTTPAKKPGMNRVKGRNHQSISVESSSALDNFNSAFIIVIGWFSVRCLKMYSK